MRDAEKREAGMDRLWGIVPLVVVSALIAIAFFGERGLFRALELARHEEQLQLQVSKAEAENARLKNRITALQKDPGAIEEAARSGLGMVREGEIVYQFPAGD